MIRAPDNSNRKTILPTVCQDPVPAGERLVVNLLAGFGVSSTVTGIDDLIAEILIVFVAAREDY